MESKNSYLDSRVLSKGQINFFVKLHEAWSEKFETRNWLPVYFNLRHHYVILGSPEIAWPASSAQRVLAQRSNQRFYLILSVWVRNLEEYHANGCCTRKGFKSHVVYIGEITRTTCDSIVYVDLADIAKSWSLVSRPRNWHQKKGKYVTKPKSSKVTETPWEKAKEKAWWTAIWQT